MPGMILLKPGNRILEETFRSQLMAEGKREAVDVRLNDFDDVKYRVCVEKDDLDTLKFSMSLPCWEDIKAKGGEDALKEIYGEWVVEPETGFEISLAIKIPEVKDKEKAVESLQLMKSKITGSIFNYYFNGLRNKEARENHKVSIRSDTVVYFVPRDDRCILIFSIDFNERVDKEIAKVFMNELQTARRTMQQAPPVNFSVEPPNELSEFGVTSSEGGLGYLSFAILPSHVKNEAQMQAATDVLQSFRTFIQYHIKAAKTYFHTKMRKRVVELQKVLNRAKEMEGAKKEKKTAGGKTFKRS